MAVHQVKSDMLCENHVYITHYADCSCTTGAVRKYWVTDPLGYRYIHTTLGSKRYWNTYSGAYKFAKKLNEWQDEQDTKLQNMIVAF